MHLCGSFSWLEVHTAGLAKNFSCVQILIREIRVEKLLVVDILQGMHFFLICQQYLVSVTVCSISEHKL